MATKRLRMWVNEYVGDDEGPGGLSDVAWRTKAQALSSIGSDGKAVPFIERLPGDVVLSREEQYDVAQAVAVKLKWLLSLEEEASDVVTAVLYELKSRGRR